MTQLEKKTTGKGQLLNLKSGAFPSSKLSPLF
jgi:hypothetical protein